uniref:CaM_binding domain-containing protein n=1 Tax=Syphacia muris TaxID=451379 RepID=A0A0N5AA27_9BILA
MGPMREVMRRRRGRRQREAGDKQEIAAAPHTQRRVAKDSSGGGSQSFSSTSSTFRSFSPQRLIVSTALTNADSLTHKSKKAQAYNSSEERNSSLLSPESSTNLTDMTHTACINVTGSNCVMSSSGTRSYAEIAKRKSPVSSSSCAVLHASAGDVSPGDCAPSTSANNNDERCTSVTSSAGGSVEIIDKDGLESNNQQLNSGCLKSSVDGFSFFYDPNEPTTICDTQTTAVSEENSGNCDFFSLSTQSIAKLDDDTKRGKTRKSNGKTVGKREEGTDVRFKKGLAENAVKSEKEAGSSFVLKLKLENGRTILLPSMNVSGSFEVDRKKKEIMSNAWKNFMESVPAPIRYKPGVLQGVSSNGNN